MTDVGTPETLAGILDAHADATKGAWVFHLADGPRRVEADELRATALARAGQLLDLGLEPGQPVGLVGPNHPDWLGWAFGAWMAGAALVPLPAPTRIRDPEGFGAQIESLTSTLGCRYVVAHPKYLPAVNPDRAIDWDGPPAAGTALTAAVEAAPDDIALILCTSGSTSQPKGIRVTQSSAAARLGVNTAALGNGMLGMSALSWLPLYHLLGLIGLFQPLQGVVANLLPAERFARDPGEWLRLVGPTQATMTGAASSAWAAATRSIARRPEGVDLSSLALAMFSMEMIDPDVVDRLLEVGVPLGLKPEALFAVYGLSEGGGTSSGFGGGIRIDEVDLETLVSSGRAEPPIPGRPTKRVASCGALGKTGTTELLVGTPGEPAPERVVGEIHFRGPRMMEGYLSAEVTQPFDEEGWFRTGDLGYVSDGELFVTGRSKEIIVHLGRNYHPEDVEWAAARVPGVGEGGCVAFAPAGGAEGELVVVVEAPEGTDGEDLSFRVKAAVADVVGLTPRHVVIVADGTIPHAANGKLQRLAARSAYERGELS